MLHWNLAEGNPAADAATGTVATRYDDGNNLLMKVFGAERMEPQEGWVSYRYRERSPRPAYVFTRGKKAGETVRMVTVLLPVTEADGHRIELAERRNGLQVKIDGRRYKLK